MKKKLVKRSQTRLTTRWVPSTLDKEFITCENCKSNNFRFSRAWNPKFEFKKIYNFCPICGARFKGAKI